MSRHRVVVSDVKTVDPAIERETLDADVTVVTAHTVGELVDAAAGADGLVVDAATPVTAEVFERVESLQVVGRAGVGVDNVDLAAAADHGVEVVHAPDYCVEEVSTHALALLLAAARKVARYERDVRAGGWDWEVGRPIHRLAGATLGLVGFGKIPRRLAEKVAGFDLDVVAYDPYVGSDEMADRDVENVPFEHLLESAAFVSVHAPLTDETRGLFDADAFAAMREDAVLVNTARGPVVDQDALYDALVRGDVAGAALDVLEREPPDDPPLVDLENAVVTPHVGWYSEDSRAELSRSVAADVARVLRGEEPESPAAASTDWD